MAEKFNLSVILKFIDKSAQGLKGFQANMSKVGKKMQNVGKTMSMAVTAPVVLLAGNAIRMGAQYQDTMNMVGAVTNTTGKEFEKLKNLSQKLGATTRFSAVEAGEAMKFMGMAGFDVNKIMKATPHVLGLAAAAQLDMGTAADIVTNIMSGYGDKAGKLSDVNDILVSTFTNANVSLPQLGEAMKNVGAMAAINNIPIGQMAAVLGVLGNAGIQGAEAGTSMKMMISKLAKPAKEATKQMRFLELELFNTDGSMKDIIGIMKEFENAQKKGATAMQVQTAAYTIFGTRAGPRLVTLLGQGSKAVEDLTKKNKENLGITKKIEEKMKEGLPGALAKLESAWKGVNIALTEGAFGKWVENTVRGLADLTSGIGDFAKTHPEITKWGLVLTGIFAVGGPLLVGLGAATIALGAISWPIILIGAAIAGVTAGMILLMDRIDEKHALDLKKLEVVHALADDAPLSTKKELDAIESSLFLDVKDRYENKQETPIITVKVEAANGTSAQVVKTKGNVVVENTANIGPTLLAVGGI